MQHLNPYYRHMHQLTSQELLRIAWFDMVILRETNISTTKHIVRYKNIQVTTEVVPWDGGNMTYHEVHGSDE